jgi:hypothetical protein
MNIIYYSAKCIIPPFCLFILIIFISGCAPVRDNPLDIQSDNFIHPQVIFLFENHSNLTDNILDTIYNDSVGIIWGDKNDYVEFRYTIDNQEWSDWSGMSGASFFFSEGKHTITVESQHINMTGLVKDSLSFFVKSLPEKSIYLTPRFLKAGSGSSVVTVKSSSIGNAAMIHLVFKGAEIDSAWLAENLQGQNLQILYSKETVDMIVFPGTVNLSGDISLVSLRLKTSVTDSARVDFSECILRDSLNQKLTVNSTRGCIIAVR